VQALLVVDLRDEAVDAATGVIEIREGLAVDLLGLSVFMKLSALALSKGLPGLLMLMVISRSASCWR
jgi:hypothetical protein